MLPPFSLKLGKQQIVWGETDNFRALDVINPLDLSWHWQWESWEDIRIPLWAARGVYDIGKIGKLEESFLEIVYIPWDVRQNVVETNPNKPWSLYGPGAQARANSAFVGNDLLDLNLQVIDGRPEQSLENGQAGFRFKAVWGNVDFSFNYFYGFSADARAQFRNEFTRVTPTTLNAVVETKYPRNHLIGFTANYSEEKYTQTVFRLETTFTTGVPITIAPGAPLSVDPEQDQFETAPQRGDARRRSPDLDEVAEQGPHRLPFQPDLLAALAGLRRKLPRPPERAAREPERRSATGALRQREQ